jgi:tRNA A37 methylthiotransferase MiaB
MRRNHTREAYLELAERVRKVVPGVTLSSDFIVGFCGESEEEFAETLEMVEKVGY